MNFPERYDIHELLGRGGMAAVYRAVDRATGRQVALKQLSAAKVMAERVDVAAMFEREYHALTQLRHPHVIEVYDYGLAGDGTPYYTMELLDGGDLHGRAPLPYRDACRLLFDVCSSLALIHSRRLLHRDISPRNIWCTHDGHAKLIDFGALAPMSSSGGDIVGTPAFTAPETLHRLAVDARTDLYSLGVTLYFALTGRLPYPARTFADVLSAWNSKPMPPSAAVPGLPVALDDLVLSLISLEPARRPESAFSVMQQLAACADLPRDEAAAVSRAYLVTPTLVARAELLASVRETLKRAGGRRGGGLLFRGAPGVGRSRLLDACALEAKTLGFTALRATASGAREPFEVVKALVQHLTEALPSSAADPDFAELFDPERAQDLLCRFFIQASQVSPLLIAVDDVHRIDSKSAAVLAALIDKARRARISVALTASSDADTSEALSAFTGRCESLSVGPLSGAETHALLESMFGDVAHLGALSSEIQRIAQGNPRQCIDLAQHLVDRGTIRYAAGAWTLPSQLPADALPESATEALRARIAGASEQARFLAECQALAFAETFTDDDYRSLLHGASSLAVEAAVSELLALQVLVENGASYTLAHRMWTSALVGALNEEELQRRHVALANLYEPKSPYARIHHLFSAGLYAPGLELMIRNHERYRAQGGNFRDVFTHNVGRMVWCTNVAVEIAPQLGYDLRHVTELRRWRYAGGITTGEGVYDAHAQLWHDELVRGSGLDLYRADSANPNTLDRLTRALQGAQQRYLETPESERVYTVEESLRQLCEYVVYSIAIGGRTQNGALLRTLPALLEPFAPLSPILNAIWKNALATCCLQLADYEAARAHWVEVFDTLDNLSGEQPAYIEPLKNAVAYALGLIDSQLGLASALGWAERLDHDPFQRVAALVLRKLVRLMQGDAKGAERFQRQAEVLALQLSAPEMFKGLLSVEHLVYAKTRDLPGIQRVIEDMKPLAARCPGWIPDLTVGEASFHLVRGDYVAAKHKYAECVALTKPGLDGLSNQFGMWIASSGGLAEALLALDDTQEALAVASAALADCERRQLGSASFDLIIMVALAESRLNLPGAAQRLEDLIERQAKLGVTGLRLGLVYEARAQIALHAGDRVSFEHYAQLTAREYRHGAGSPLGARYERLMNEAARAGLEARFSLTDFATAAGRDTSSADDVVTMVTRSMTNKAPGQERVQVALQLICAAFNAKAGHMYLMADDRLILRASHGGESPLPSLTSAAREYVDDHRRRAEDLDEMITGAAGETLASAVASAGGADYQLLPLSCVTSTAEVQIVGLAAVRAGEGIKHGESQQRLLGALASHLLDPGS